MNDSSIVASLTSAIATSKRAMSYCIGGKLPNVDPAIEIEGFGAMKLPLSPKDAKKLIAACKVAPFGKGTATLVDRKVRNTFELDPAQFRLDDKWNAAVEGILGQVAEKLGLPADRLEAKLYKLLVYGKGGFFLPHRDSEKQNRMLASLIVALPNEFKGGKLVVRHGEGRTDFPFDEALDGKSPCFAAFYADCEHEVREVLDGHRLCLAYNLVLKPGRAKPKAAGKPATPVDDLAEAIGSWTQSQPTEPLVFALDHHYTERGIKPDLLKGADRKLAELVMQAAERKGCLVHLAQVTRHLLQSTVDDYYGGRRGKQRADGIQIEETIEDELSGSHWTDSEGRVQAFGEIDFDIGSIISSTPVDDWVPTEEEYEGYTGNAGNTLDRWYHRSALFVWRRDRHFDIIAGGGAAVTVPMLVSMTGKLAKTPKAKLESSRADAIRFARAIIAGWPKDYGRGDGGKTPYDDVPKCVLKLHDKETIAFLLSTLAERDRSHRLASFLSAACKEFGWPAFAKELKQLLASKPPAYGGSELAPRDAEWLAVLSDESEKGSESAALADELCKAAVERFLKTKPEPEDDYDRRRKESGPAAMALLKLLQAVIALGRMDDLERVVEFVRQRHKIFFLDDCQVPCLVELVPWAKERMKKVPAPVAAWLSAVRAELKTATANRPTRPADWARPAEVACACRYCAELKAFLSDSAKEVGRIPAPEGNRTHLTDAINRNGYDVKHTVEKRGSPYSLILTKTTGSFERATKRYEMDLALLEKLPLER